MDLSQIKLNLNNLDSIPLQKNHEELISKVSNIIDDTLKNSDLLCNAECKKNKKEQQLFDDFNKSQQIMLDAPKNLQNAERNFFIFKNGESEYNSLVEKENINNINEIISQLDNDYQSEYNKINVLLNNINTQQISNNYVDELDNNYAEKLNNLQFKTENEISNGAISNRESVYIEKKINNWNILNKFIIIVLFSLNFIYLYLFIVYSQYNEILHIIGIIIISILSLFNLFYIYIK